MANGYSLALLLGESDALDTKDLESTLMFVSSRIGSALSFENTQTLSEIAQLRASLVSEPDEIGPSSEQCQNDLQHRCFLTLLMDEDCQTSHQVHLPAIPMVKITILYLS